MEVSSCWEDLPNLNNLPVAFWHYPNYDKFLGHHLQEYIYNGECLIKKQMSLCELYIHYNKLRHGTIQHKLTQLYIYI